MGQQPSCLDGKNRNEQVCHVSAGAFRHRERLSTVDRQPDKSGRAVPTAHGNVRDFLRRCAFGQVTCVREAPLVRCLQLCL